LGRSGLLPASPQYNADVLVKTMYQFAQNYNFQGGLKPKNNILSP